MRKVLPFVLAVCLSNCAYCQTIFAEFDLASKNIDYIQAFQVHDSIFLSFSEQNVKKNYWINENGIPTEVKLKIPSGAPIAGVLQHADTTFYYYLNNVNDNMILQVMEQTAGEPEIRFSRSIFPVPGKLLGVHVDRKTVTLVSYYKKENNLRVLTLSGLHIHRENLFKMPFDLAPHIKDKDNAGFIAEKELASIEKGAKTFKLYRERNHVVITIDDDQPGNKNSKTTIIKLDVSTGGKEVYELKRDDYDKFISFYYKDKVYQLVNSPRKYFYCNVYDLKSGKTLFNERIEKEKTLQEHKIIVRRGKTKEVGYTNLYEMINMEDTTPSIFVQSAPDSTQLRLMLGTVFHYDESGFPLFFLGFWGYLPLILHITMDTHANALYFILKGNYESGFDFETLENNAIPSMRQAVDEYEISRTSGKTKGLKRWVLQYKAYLELNDGVLGIYQEAGKKLTLLKYTEKK